MRQELRISLLIDRQHGAQRTVPVVESLTILLSGREIRLA